MTFISYAQNFEDIMLWRVLKHVDNGFYIDVGANDPEVDSVTRAFYDKGWRGINIEPVAEWFERLKMARPRDINLQVALGAKQGKMTLYEIPGTGLSTAEKEFAERHADERGYTFKKISVKVDTLTKVCEQFHVAPIHFLKIDVEGGERSVLEGIDFDKIRPWIVLVESTMPNTQEEKYSEWEQLLLDARYDYVYFDGLNRFYVAVEHPELKPAFTTPPNVFDSFVLNKQLVLERRAARAEAEQARLEQLQPQLELAEQRIETLERELTDTRTQTNETLNILSQHAEAQSQQLREEAEKAQTLQQQLMEATVRAAAEQARTEQLQNTIESEQSKLEQLISQVAEKNQALVASQAEVEQLHAHSQWLQNEWYAAKAKIDELNHSSHHWWTVADGLNQELQTVYRSKSWRITWPLRKLMQLLKWLFRLPVQLVTGFVRLPKRAARWILTKSIAFVLRRERLKNRTRQRLYRHPKLEAHLRAFARARGLIHGSILVPQHSVEMERQAADKAHNARKVVQDLTGNDHVTATLTPRARRIYADLKAAIDKNKKENA